jgi:hemerythrin-like metal-binding protein
LFRADTAGENMGLLLWDDSLRINIKEIDNQHENLFSVINQLHDSLKYDNDDKEPKSVLNSLLEFIMLHYATEEQWMKKYNYPEYKVHKDQHQIYVSKIKEFVGRYKTGNADLPAKDILLSLAGWHSKHIIDYDKKFGRFIKENQGG